MQHIYLHNTYTSEVERFDPITPGHVGMYHCGPTVYSKSHIGHARPYIFADVLRRLFEYNGYTVTQVINITDVGHLTDDASDGEDKVEKFARESNQRAQDIAEHYTQDFFTLLDQLNVLRSRITFPRATDHIPEQIDMIQALEERGATYTTTDGVYFDTSVFPSYGTLGNINVENLKEGARVDVNEEKRNPTDFALWKFSKPEDKRQQEWESPWGVGFPGWHIECSAMSQKYLGTTFDIHTGGVDHIPVHHNNEIAQSETANGAPLANYWLHVNHILINGEKIGKSLGNALYLDDLEARGISPLGYRYWLLTADYKTLINVSWDSLAAANTAFEKLIMHLARLPDGGVPDTLYQQQMTQAITDDVHTARVIALIWELLKDPSVEPAHKKATIFDIDRILGLNLEALAFLATDVTQSVTIPAHVAQLIEEREKARKAGNYSKSDALREMIREEGFELIDGKNGPTVSPL